MQRWAVVLVVVGVVVGGAVTGERSLTLTCFQLQRFHSLTKQPPTPPPQQQRQQQRQVYHDYLLPSLSLLPNDPEETVRVEYALGVAHLAASAHRHLVQLQFGGGGGSGVDGAAAGRALASGPGSAEAAGGGAAAAAAAAEGDAAAAVAAAAAEQAVTGADGAPVR